MQTRTRPLILVGHSLGGLVIQQALVLADHHDDSNEVRSSVAGALYLGIRMKGADAAGILLWASAVVGNNQPLLNTLEANSGQLRELMSDYWCSYGDIETVCFNEKYASTYGPVNTVVSAFNKAAVRELSCTNSGRKFQLYDW